MGVFSYILKDKEGKAVSGQIEADSKDKALELLHIQGGVVLSLREVKAKGKKNVKKGKVSIDELVIFSRQLTTLIESGIPIVEAIDILRDQTQNLYFRGVLAVVLKELREGSSFARSIAKYPRIFPEIYVSMVEAAETSGNLPQILDRLSVYLEKTSALRKKVISSLIYPAIIFTMAISATGFLVFKIVPIFAQLYKSLGSQLPFITQILVNFSQGVKKNIVAVLIVLAVLIFALKKYISTPKGRRQYDMLLIKMPVIGEVVKKVSIAQFARTFATLVRSGVAIVRSLEIVGKTSGNKIIEEAVESAQVSIQEGVPLSHPLEESGIFPPMVVKMIAVGERTGKLEHMLDKIAQFYEEQTEAAIAALTSVLEPILIVFLGIVVGFIVIALFLPIFNISQAVLHAK